MTEVVQQVLFELEESYLGHPYFVTGNALWNAVAQRVDAETRRSLSWSHGVFLPGEYGDYPEGHSLSGGAGKLGTGLPEVNAYEDLFVFRDQAHRWLKESRPRDAHNTFDLETHGDRVAFAPTCYFGRPPLQRNSKRAVQLHVHAYVTASTPGVLPLGEDVLDGLRVGGARNHGLGVLSLTDSQVVDLDELDYSGVRNAHETEGLQLELLTPFVTASEHPSVDAQSIPEWWGVEDGLRRRETRLVDGADTHVVSTVDHGQVVAYEGSRPVETARNGVLRIGTHSQFGFGEFRLRPRDRDRVWECDDA